MFHSFWLPQFVSPLKQQFESILYQTVFWMMAAIQRWYRKFQNYFTCKNENFFEKPVDFKIRGPQNLSLTNRLKNNENQDVVQTIRKPYMAGPLKMSTRHNYLFDTTERRRRPKTNIKMFNFTCYYRIFHAHSFCISKSE